MLKKFIVLKLVALAPVFFSLQLMAQKATKKDFTVVLDPGHGGHDSGNRGNGFFEKKIALNIVLHVGRILEKQSGIKVIYTRTDDTFVTLHGRAKIANDADADLFVSVHCNAHNSDAHGTESWVLGLHANERNFEVAKKENEVIYLEEDYEAHYEGFDPSSPESMIGLLFMQEEYLDQSTQLATYLENNFSNHVKLNSRGVKQAGFWVLHNTYMPSVLIETGFLTYKKEGTFLNSPKGQKQMAQSIADAIIQYKKDLDSNVGIAIKDKPGAKPDTRPIMSEAEAGTQFKVQIFASSKDLDTAPQYFKGLSPVSKLKEGTLFKYYFGATSDYDEAKKLQILARNKGFDTCFIVAFNNGKHIKLQDALKSRSE